MYIFRPNHPPKNASRQNGQEGVRENCANHFLPFASRPARQKHPGMVEGAHPFRLLSSSAEPYIRKRFPISNLAFSFRYTALPYVPLLITLCYDLFMPVCATLFKVCMFFFSFFILGVCSQLPVFSTHTRIVKPSATPSESRPVRKSARNGVFFFCYANRHFLLVSTIKGKKRETGEREKGKEKEVCVIPHGDGPTLLLLLLRILRHWRGAHVVTAALTRSDADVAPARTRGVRIYRYDAQEEPSPTQRAPVVSS